MSASNSFLFNDKYEEICNFIVMVESEEKEIGTNKTYFNLVCRQGFKKYRLTIDSAALSRTPDLEAALLGAIGSSCDIVRPKELKRAILDMSKQRHVRRIIRLTRIGYIDGKFIYPGRIPDNYNIHLPRCLAFNIHTTDNPKEALSALIDCVPNKGKAIVLLSFLFGCSLAAKIDLSENERYGMFIAGTTGTMKTSWLQVAMCLFGDFDSNSILIRYETGATHNALVKIAETCGDSPLFIDNYKPNVFNSKQFSILVSLLKGFEEKVTISSSRLKAVFRNNTTWPILTADDYPKEFFTQSEFLPVDWQKPDSKKLSKAQRLSGQLKGAMAIWMDWLEKLNDDQIEGFLSHYELLRKDWTEQINQINPKVVNVSRIASNLALNRLVFGLLASHPFFGDIFDKHRIDHIKELKYMCVESN